MSNEAEMWWYEQHERALMGLRRLVEFPSEAGGISKLYQQLMRLTRQERLTFKELASQLAGHYAFGTVQWDERTVEGLRSQFNYHLEGMNIGVSAANTHKVKTLVALFGLEQIIHQIGGRQIIMTIKPAS